MSLANLDEPFQVLSTRPGLLLLGKLRYFLIWQRATMFIQRIITCI
jgi:hypothetical protein